MPRFSLTFRIKGGWWELGAHAGRALCVGRAGHSEEGLTREAGCKRGPSLSTLRSPFLQAWGTCRSSHPGLHHSREVFKSFWYRKLREPGLGRGWTPVSLSPVTDRSRKLRSLRHLSARSQSLHHLPRECTSGRDSSGTNGRSLENQ